MYQLHWKLFPNKEKGDRVDFFFFLLTNKVIFLFGEFKVQERPTFLLPQFIIDSEASYVKAWKLNGKELSDRSGLQECAILYPSQPPLTHTKHTTVQKVHTDNSSFKNDLLNICCPLTAWFPAPEGKEVKKKDENKTNLCQTKCRTWQRRQDAMFELDTLQRTTSVLRDSQFVLRNCGTWEKCKKRFFSPMEKGLEERCSKP